MRFSSHIVDHSWLSLSCFANKISNVRLVCRTMMQIFRFLAGTTLEEDTPSDKVEIHRQRLDQLIDMSKQFKFENSNFLLPCSPSKVLTKCQRKLERLENFWHQWLSVRFGLHKCLTKTVVCSCLWEHNVLSCVCSLSLSLFLNPTQTSERSQVRPLNSQMHDTIGVSVTISIEIVVFEKNSCFVRAHVIGPNSLMKRDTCHTFWSWAWLWRLNRFQQTKKTWRKHGSLAEYAKNSPLCMCFQGKNAITTTASESIEWNCLFLLAVCFLEFKTNTSSSEDLCRDLVERSKSLQIQIKHLSGETTSEHEAIEDIKPLRCVFTSSNEGQCKCTWRMFH